MLYIQKEKVIGEGEYISRMPRFCGFNNIKAVHAVDDDCKQYILICDYDNYPKHIAGNYYTDSGYLSKLEYSETTYNAMGTISR